MYSDGTQMVLGWQSDGNQMAISRGALGTLEHLLRLLGMQTLELRHVCAVRLEARRHLDEAAVQLGSATLSEGSALLLPDHARLQALHLLARLGHAALERPLERLLLAQRRGQECLGLLSSEACLGGTLLVPRAALGEHLLSGCGRGRGRVRLVRLRLGMLQLALQAEAMRGRSVCGGARVL